jgi:hypothetical protein
MDRELQNRTDDLVLPRWWRETEAQDVPVVGVPGKQTLVERGDPRIAELRRRAAAGELPPGKWTLVEATIAATPKQSFAGCQVRALRDVLLRLGSNHELHDATLAAADPHTAWHVIDNPGSAAPSGGFGGFDAPPGGHREPHRDGATPHGQAMWGAAQARAVTLYRRARSVGIGAPETPEVTAALDRIGMGAPLPEEVRRRMEAMVGKRWRMFGCTRDLLP